MVSAALVLALLTFALAILAWPPERDQQRQAGGSLMAGPLIWTASIGESQWHGVMRFEWSGTRPIAVCGHVVRGKVHGRRSVEPPEDEHRSTCRGCLSALFVRFGGLPEPFATTSSAHGRHRAEDTDRTLHLARVLDLFPAWPLVDRDIETSDRRLLAA